VTDASGYPEPLFGRDSRVNCILGHKQRNLLGFFDKLEKNLERKVTGLFSKTFKSGLEPVEIASAIRQEVDSRASIISRDKIMVPNSYEVLVSPSDHEKLAALGQALIEELELMTVEHCKKQRFQFGEALVIKISADPKLALGQVSVLSSSEKVEVSWVPVLELDSKSYELKKSRTTVGRDASADIQIGDNGLSRKHFEVIWDGSNAAVRDLGSTNGTKINGRKIDQVAISADTVISAGRSNFVFKVIMKPVTK
jgi:hypothetical protein